MKLGSLFDGSGGFPLAGTLAGIEPVWASEIEPYPIAVTRSRFPNMKHLGSVTEVCGGEIEPVDVITFGSPCQDLSIAGRRAGIHDGERSNLFFEAIRIIREMREKTNGRYPTFAVWENVPGAFTSNNGDDFRCVLEAFCEVCGAGGDSVPQPQNGKWQKAGEILGEGFSVAWRLLDAQYWGVPQRRKRIYLVADFTGQRAGKILFERDSLQRDSTQSRKSREDTSGDAEDSVGSNIESNCLTPYDHQRCRLYETNGIFPTLGASDGRNNQAVVYPLNEQLVTRCKALGERTGLGVGKGNDPAFTLQAAHPHAVCYALDSMSSNSMKSDNPNSGFHETTITKTLQAGGVDPTCNQGGNVIVYPNVARSLCARADSSPCVDRGQNFICYAIQGNGIGRSDTNGCDGCGWREDKCYTLNTVDRHSVAYTMHDGCFPDVVKGGSGTLTARDYKAPRIVGYSITQFAQYNETQPTLRASGGDLGGGSESLICMATGQTNAEITEDFTPTITAEHEHPILQHEYIVRRLTPTECARLQGFPDCWGHPDVITELTDDEAEFWETVRKTYAEANGKTYKPLSRESLLKWHNGLHTDSSEYKMWGNGIALPCAEYVLEGIAAELKSLWLDELLG